MVWRRRKVERVRLGIITDRNFEICGPQLCSGIFGLGNAIFVVRGFGNCGPQIFFFKK
jgi:hypothetical protein